jgi:hypothetical protein
MILFSRGGCWDIIMKQAITTPFQIHTYLAIFLFDAFSVFKGAPVNYLRMFHLEFYLMCILCARSVELGTTHQLVSPCLGLRQF